ncbi:MAG: hypothetical protein AB7F43_01680 [Bacteriovoracia bacterium]
MKSFVVLFFISSVCFASDQGLAAGCSKYAHTGRKNNVVKRRPFRIASALPPAVQGLSRHSFESLISVAKDEQPVTTKRLLFDFNEKEHFYVNQTHYYGVPTETIVFEFRKFTGPPEEAKTLSETQMRRLAASNQVVIREKFLYPAIQLLMHSYYKKRGWPQEYWGTLFTADLFAGESTLGIEVLHENYNIIVGVLKAEKSTTDLRLGDYLDIHKTDALRGIAINFLGEFPFSLNGVFNPEGPTEVTLSNKVTGKPFGAVENVTVPFIPTERDFKIFIPREARLRFPYQKALDLYARSTLIELGWWKIGGRQEDLSPGESSLSATDKFLIQLKLLRRVLFESLVEPDEIDEIGLVACNGEPIETLKTRSKVNRDLGERLYRPWGFRTIHTVEDAGVLWHVQTNTLNNLLKRLYVLAKRHSISSSPSSISAPQIRAFKEKIDQALEDRIREPWRIDYLATRNHRTKKIHIQGHVVPAGISRINVFPLRDASLPAFKQRMYNWTLTKKDKQYAEIQFDLSLPDLGKPFFLQVIGDDDQTLEFFPIRIN